MFKSKFKNCFSVIDKSKFFNSYIKMNKYALVSVEEKSPLLINLCKKIKEIGYEIIATKGTRNFLLSNDVEVKGVDEIVGFREALGGKVKTLHPLIHEMILANRDSSEEMEIVKNLGLIDYVFVNFYKINIEEPDSFLNSLDIGGRALISSAIKNSKYVTVAFNEETYNIVLKEIQEHGYVREDTRRKLAIKAFNYLINYEVVAYSYASEIFSNEISFGLLLTKGEKLKYGENPHQYAFLFQYDTDPNIKLQMLHGDYLTYNNYLDIDSAIRLLSEFDENACAIIKHTNPCGVACDSNSIQCFEKAYNADPVSAYGGILAFNFMVDKELAKVISKYFFDVIIAKDYEDEAFEILSSKKKTRIIRCEGLGSGLSYALELRSIVNGILIQSRDVKKISNKDLIFVTERKPNKDELEDLIFAWKIVKRISSNGIVVAKNKVSLGIGAGQMSRIDSVKIALEKSGGNTKNAVLASDGFFPFRDSIDLSAKFGITAIIQPGGSIRDKEVIQAANEHNIAMVFTGIRAFRH